MNNPRPRPSFFGFAVIKGSNKVSSNAISTPRPLSSTIILGFSTMILILPE